jgi:hypothetical protein
VRRSVLSAPTSIGIRVEGDFVILFDANRSYDDTPASSSLYQQLTGEVNVPFSRHLANAYPAGASSISSLDTDEGLREWHTDVVSRQVQNCTCEQPK